VVLRNTKTLIYRQPTHFSITHSIRDFHGSIPRISVVETGVIIQQTCGGWIVGETQKIQNIVNLHCMTLHDKYDE
jgi:hypothetical protein